MMLTKLQVFISATSFWASEKDMTKVRGLRGATTADSNTKQAIFEATQELLTDLIKNNGILPDDVAAVIFSTTRDLTAAVPARAAREMGWTEVVYMDVQEMDVAKDVPSALPLCIRVLVLVNTDKSPKELRDSYLKGAAILRPDKAT